MAHLDYQFVYDLEPSGFDLRIGLDTTVHKSTIQYTQLKNSKEDILNYLVNPPKNIINFHLIREKIDEIYKINDKARIEWFNILCDLFDFEFSKEVLFCEIKEQLTSIDIEIISKVFIKEESNNIYTLNIYLTRFTNSSYLKDFLNKKSPA